MIWRNNDLNQMERYYANSSNGALATLLGRTRASIEHKARRIGLHKVNPNAKHDKNVVISAKGRKRSVRP